MKGIPSECTTRAEGEKRKAGTAEVADKGLMGHHHPPGGDCESEFAFPQRQPADGSMRPRLLLLN